MTEFATCNSNVPQPVLKNSAMRYSSFLDLSHEFGPLRLDHVITDSRAWTAEEIVPEDCIIYPGSAVEKEFLRMAEFIEDNPLPTVLRHPSQFEMPETERLMRDVKKRLDRPPNVVVIDKLRLDKISIKQATDIYWTIGQLIGKNVAQKWNGTMVYDVRDHGTPLQYGVRGSYTTVELLFHNDNAFGARLPEYVGLLCIRPSLEGGISRFCSMYTIHNRMLEQYPNELERLYKPVLWDRQAEHPPGAPTVSWAPVFSYDGKKLRTRANPSLIVYGYKIAGIEMDPKTADAVYAMKAVSEDPEIWFSLPIQRGQIQYINNIEIAHYRSEIIDHPDLVKKRHLIRIWHRDEGNATYDG